jgi:hypothetical protein
MTASLPLSVALDACAGGVAARDTHPPHTSDIRQASEESRVCIVIVLSENLLTL